MSSTKHGALIVFGSGPGIGRNVAALFAERGFSRIILLSRDTNRLKEDAVFVQKSSKATVDVVRIDLADTQNVRKALMEVDRLLSGTPLEAVLFNAARVGVSKMFEFAPEQLESDLRVSRGMLQHKGCYCLTRSCRYPSSACTRSLSGQCRSLSKSLNKGHTVQHFWSHLACCTKTHSRLCSLWHLERRLNTI